MIFMSNLSVIKIKSVHSLANMKGIEDKNNEKSKGVIRIKRSFEEMKDMMGEFWNQHFGINKFALMLIMFALI